MNDDVMDQCYSLGEIVYLDTPTDQLTKRIMARPTGCDEIVGFDQNDPKSFYDTRVPYYSQFTRRVKFGRNETIEQSVDHLKGIRFYFFFLFWSLKKNKLKLRIRTTDLSPSVQVNTNRAESRF